MGSEKNMDDQISLAEFLPWAEFVCWVMLVLAPTLYFFNGPSVSPDQAAVRTELVVFAAAGAGTLRWINSKRRKRICSNRERSREASRD